MEGHLREVGLTVVATIKATAIMLNRIPTMTLLNNPTPLNIRIIVETLTTPGTTLVIMTKVVTNKVETTRRVILEAMGKQLPLPVIIQATLEVNPLPDILNSSPTINTAVEVDMEAILAEAVLQEAMEVVHLRLKVVMLLRHLAVVAMVHQDTDNPEIIHVPDTKSI